jgi:acetyl-CoA/propionyl-CoA carboxylase biotin carboxyl carrier protein
VVEPLGNGRFLVSAGVGLAPSEVEGDPGAGSRRLAYAVRDRHRTWVFIDGRTYVIEPETRDGSDRVHVTDDQVALSAPMPATVIAIKVAPGQEVAAGDLLVLLEAMKMEMPITAPRGGRVKSIACREGELVQPGVPLLEFE